jgi:ribosomal 50S subunit-recycling heat shock protein
MKFWLKPGSFSIRLDQLLVAVGLFESKLLAGKQIKKGLISVNESTEFDYARKLVENDKIRFGDNFYYIAMKKDDRFLKKSDYHKYDNNKNNERKNRNISDYDSQNDKSKTFNHYNKDSSAIEHNNNVRKWVEKPIKMKKK